MRVAKAITLTAVERTSLSRWARGRKTPARQVLRANIVLAEYSGENLAAALLRQDIHVADFHSRPGMQNCMRIAVGDEEAIERLLEALVMICVATS